MDFEAVHPETVAPGWFQELVRRAYERELRRLELEGMNSDDALEAAMWYAFDLYDQPINKVYQLGMPNQIEEGLT